MPREREPVRAERDEVDRAVRRQLGGVDEQPCAVGVREGGRAGDGQQLAGDVRGPGQGDEGDVAAAQLGLEARERLVDRPRVRDAAVGRARAAGRRPARLALGGRTIGSG